MVFLSSLGQPKEVNSFIRDAEKFGAHNYHPLPVVLSSARGVWLKDTRGRKYLDCLASYSAVNPGHCHPEIVKALKHQAQKLTLCSRAFHHEGMGAFLKQLCRITQMEAALLMNTGTEAVETAIKLARKWGYQKRGVPDERAEIIVCENNFHGRSTTVISFSTEPQYREGFGPFTPGFRVVPFGDAQALKRAITPHTVAFLFEPIQGEAGVLIPETGYLAEVRKICTEHSLLMIADEIQTGLGRTGKLFAYEHEPHSKPDVLILGKALGGGVYPVSAVLSSWETMSVFRPGDHGSTFGGNPLACAVGSAALRVILREKLAQNAERMGKILVEKLNALHSPHIENIRGRGLMIGVDIRRESGSARSFCERLMKLGVLCKDTHGQTLRITPPLVIRRKEIDWLFARLKAVFLADDEAPL